ncbi:cell death regulator Aven isoform X2 [Electrophorus electricus]|uniref:cell death regulator Aven isoform X2 n=1 Tax=Electrophorus electricus TaxID=8005 RepID=UPI0015D08C0B|nr:cell death regulator Aven isoform X2 [Electrophorus electricus]
MEGRPGRGRGGHWKRGGSGGANDAGSFGERRGRGRGGHRGRSKRDHYRGRGRGASDGAADVFRRGQDDENEKENYEEEISDIYSRRKLESNWDRYEESEKEEVNDGVPVQRGTDYHVLLSSAGDSFTQFRFAEEKDWEVESLAASQVPAIVVDLEVLAQSLQELSMHKRLILEADIVQESTPVELPSVGLLNKVEPSATGGFKPPAPSDIYREPGLGGPRPVETISDPGMSSQASTAVGVPVDDADEELDLLLGLHKPVAELSLAELKTSGAVEEVPVSPEKEKMEDLVEVDQLMAEEEPKQKAEELKHEADSGKQEMTEEDLEDWLDSMIS